MSGKADDALDDVSRRHLTNSTMLMLHYCPALCLVGKQRAKVGLGRPLE